MTGEVDIVERLRELSQQSGNGRPACQAMHEAADEIERLRAGRDGAIEECAKLIEAKHTNNVGMVHPMAESDAKAIRALLSPRRP